MSGGLSLVVKLSCSMLLLIQSFNSESDVWQLTKVEIRGDPNGWASASAYRFMEGKHRIQVSWIEIRRKCCGYFWKWGTNGFLVPIRVYLQWQVKFCDQGFLGSNKSKFRIAAFSFWRRIGFCGWGQCKDGLVVAVQQCNLKYKSASKSAK